MKFFKIGKRDFTFIREMRVYEVQKSIVFSKSSRIIFSIYGDRNFKTCITLMLNCKPIPVMLLKMEEVWEIFVLLSSLFRPCVFLTTFSTNAQAQKVCTLNISRIRFFFSFLPLGLVKQNRRFTRGIILHTFHCI